MRRIQFSTQFDLRIYSSAIFFRFLSTSTIVMLQPDAVYVLKAHEPVYSLTFLNQQLLVGKKNGNVALYCLSSLRSNYELKTGPSPILYVSSHAETLITQDKTGKVKVWDLEKSGYVIRHEIDSKYLGFARAQHCTDKNILVAPSASNDISIIDLATGSEVAHLKPPADDIQLISSIKILPWFDGETYLLAGYDSGHLVLFDLKQSKSLHSFNFGFAITTQDYDRDTNRGLAGGPTNTKVCVFGIDKMTLELYRKEAETIEYIPNDGHKLAGIASIRIRPDKKCLIVGTCDGIVYIHSWKSLRKLATLRNHRGEISDIAFSNGAIDSFKSPIMAVGSSDGNISLWDIYYK